VANAEERREPLRTFLGLTLILPILAAAISPSARAQDRPVYTATYIEVMPSAVDAATAVLKRYRDSSRQAGGNLTSEALGEIARPERFVVVEAWKDQAALQAHAQSAGTTQFERDLEPIQDAPMDERISHALYIGKPVDAHRAGAIYVVTHVDVIPPGTKGCMTALKAMSVDTPSDAGNLGYDVLQQVNRANHFTVVEEWTDRKAVNAHAMAEHTRAFREKLLPIAGALYDERLYIRLN